MAEFVVDVDSHGAVFRQRLYGRLVDILKVREVVGDEEILRQSLQFILIKVLRNYWMAPTTKEPLCLSMYNPHKFLFPLALVRVPDEIIYM